MLRKGSLETYQFESSTVLDDFDDRSGAASNPIFSRHNYSGQHNSKDNSTRERQRAGVAAAVDRGGGLD
jgi:hypothetical protein